MAINKLKSGGDKDLSSGDEDGNEDVKGMNVSFRCVCEQQEKEDKMSQMQTHERKTPGKQHECQSKKRKTRLLLGNKKRDVIII